MIAKVTPHPATPEQLEYRAKRFAGAAEVLKARAAAACADCAEAQVIGSDYLCRSHAAQLNASYEEQRRQELGAGEDLEPECRRPMGGWNRSGDTMSRGE